MHRLRLTALLTALLTVSIQLAGWVGQAEPPAAIVYQAPAAFGNDLLIVDARRGLPAHLTRQPGDDFFPVWSPDGAYLVHFRLIENRYHLQLRDASGRDLGSLPLARGGLGYPAWTPDGTHITYSEERGGQSAIYSLPVECILTGIPCDPLMLAPYRAESLSWSPDQTRLAFVSNCENNCDLYLFTQATGTVVQLTRNGLYDVFPAWSPDGRWLVFMSSRRASFELYLLNPDCAAQPATCEDQLHPLTENRAFDGFPVWSPDGAQVVFSSDREGNFDLFEIEIACIGRASLPCESSARALTTSLESDISPAWSPDGAWIAYVTGNRLAVMPAAGGRVRYLAQGVQPNQALLWQPSPP
jgi:Tol biopolymer transport system component